MSDNGWGSGAFESMTPVIEQLEQRQLLALLGIAPVIQPPDVFYDSTGTLSYNASTDTFVADAVPTSILLAPGTRAIPVQMPKDYRLGISVDSQGRFAGSVFDQDLYVEGQIDINGDGIFDYSGVLLTARVVAWGYLNAGATDQYDFRLVATGGALMPFFEGQDIGMTMASVNSSFAGDFNSNFAGRSQGVIGVIPAQWSSLSGRVFDDVNNDGIDSGESGIGGATVTLSGTDIAGREVNQTVTTAPDGSYQFAKLRPGTYSIVQSQPEGYLDGSDSAGSLGGVAGNDIVSDIKLASGQAGSGYSFGEIRPSSLSGLVWIDTNGDALVDFDEKSLGAVTVQLSGLDDRGQQVELELQSDDDGAFVFLNLRPGIYQLMEVQPAGYADGVDELGTCGGVLSNDLMSSISLSAAQEGYNYNFSEQPAAGAALTQGQTATIGFWQNKNGQALLKSLNGGANATQLGDWLAATFSNMFGKLAGMTNAQVAAYYQTCFKEKGQKLDAQVLSTALAAYVTNSTLAGSAATRYGFRVSEYGVGIATYNIGLSGLAFGVQNYSTVTILTLLKATDLQSASGILYNGSQLLRNLANTVYDGINNAGDIA